MLKFGLVLGLAVMLASCDDEDSSQPRPEPTGFAIRQIDLMLQTPRDICRAKDPGFLERLMDRVTKASGFAPSGVTFHDFSVAEPDPRGLRQAILRVNIAGQGLFTATGNIDPETCFIGPMSMGPGPSSISFGDNETVRIN